MKKNYVNPFAEILAVHPFDVITTSRGGSEDNIINRVTYNSTGGIADKVSY